MAYTSMQLITDAFFVSKIVSREFESVDGTQIDLGLRLLNQNLAKKTVDKLMIPYESSYEFNFVIGQEDYPIDNLISIDTLTFIQNDVRYATRFLDRNAYRGAPRTNNINSFPFNYTFDRNFGGATISVYFFPDEAYPVTIYGLFRLPAVTLMQDLDLTIDTFYSTYLKYELVKTLCVEYSYPIPDGVRGELNNYVALIKKQSRPLDLTVNRVTTLGSIGGGLTYDQINLGRGWYPPAY